MGPVKAERPMLATTPGSVNRNDPGCARMLRGKIQASLPGFAGALPISSAPLRFAPFSFLAAKEGAVSAPHVPYPPSSVDREGFHLSGVSSLPSDILHLGKVYRRQ